MTLGRILDPWSLISLILDILDPWYPWSLILLVIYLCKEWHLTIHLCKHLTINICKEWHLTREGVTLEQSYMQPVCTPTRLYTSLVDHPTQLICIWIFICIICQQTNTKCPPGADVFEFKIFKIASLFTRRNLCLWFLDHNLISFQGLLFLLASTLSNSAGRLFLGAVG